MMLLSKKCSKCGECKNLSEFGPDKAQGKSRLRSACRECERKRWRARTKRNPRSPKVKQSDRVYALRYAEKKPWMRLHYHAGRRATKKGIPFTITSDDVKQLMASNRCAVTNIAFVRSSRGPRTPSLDRIDASKGYMRDNCRVVLFALNCAMGDWGLVALLDILQEWKR